MEVYVNKNAPYRHFRGKFGHLDWQKGCTSNHYRRLTNWDVLSVCLPLVLHVSFLVILCVPALVRFFFARFWCGVKFLGQVHLQEYDCSSSQACKCNMDFDMHQTGSRSEDNSYLQRTLTNNLQTPNFTLRPPEMPLPSATNHFLKLRLVHNAMVSRIFYVIFWMPGFSVAVNG